LVQAGKGLKVIPMGGTTLRTVLLASFVGLASTIDNGIGLTPPRGWRSWNAFDCMQEKTIITQEHMRVQMVAALDKSRLVDGRPTSLAELGFDWISMDDGWQRCNCSVRQDIDPSLPQCDGNLCFGGHCSWHDKSGMPVVRKDRFPDMKALVDFGHSLGLKVGTYLNTCICNEHGPTHYDQDVKWMVEDMGFDGVKIDNCGNSQNVSHWAELFNKTGKAIRIENCHNSWPDFQTGACPMNFFRSGGDISPDVRSILGEAYGTIDAADLREPRSHPGCWAYPDMSEVGNFPPGPSQADEERTHWGLWCIVSSPLILGFDMNDSAKMDRVWPIITNREALAVSEAWDGHPGTMIRAYPSDGPEVQVVQGECDGSSSTVGWSFADGKLLAPNPGRLPSPQCLTAPQSGDCPPPTTYFSGVQCGLVLRNCTEYPPKSRWEYADSMVRWWDGHDTTVRPRCLSALPADFDVSKGYFTRKAATVDVADCPQKPGELRVDTEGGPPELEEPSCEGLAARVRALHAAGAAAPATEQAPLTSPPSNLLFNLTSKGELRTASGKCLRTAPLSGVQLWAKPLNRSSVAVLLINPLGRPQKLVWPVADAPRKFTGAGQASADFACLPGRCSARDVWAGTDFPVTSETLQVALGPWASAFYVLRSQGLGWGREISI